MWEKLAKLHYMWLNLLESWPHSHFKREIARNDEYLNQFFPDREVLLIISKQPFKIFVKFNMFDGIGAICVLLRGQNQLGVPSG